MISEVEALKARVEFWRCRVEDQQRTIARQRQDQVELRELRERLAEIGVVHVYPEGWRCAKDGTPTIDDYDTLDLSTL